MWSMLTDLLPHQQAAAIALALQGSAKELVQSISPWELLQGGVVNGAALDPVSYILVALHRRFAQLEEETRLSAQMDMWSFARRPNENINALLSRYDTIRNRARTEGQFVMNHEGMSLQLLRAIGIGPQRFLELLQPFNLSLIHISEPTRPY